MEILLAEERHGLRKERGTRKVILCLIMTLETNRERQKRSRDFVDTENNLDGKKYFTEKPQRAKNNLQVIQKSNGN